jgi:hypothetical protein
MARSARTSLMSIHSLPTLLCIAHTSTCCRGDAAGRVSVALHEPAVTRATRVSKVRCSARRGHTVVTYTHEAAIWRMRTRLYSFTVGSRSPAVREGTRRDMA